MKRIFSRSLLFMSTGVLVLSMFANILLTTSSANAAIENPADKIEDLTKRWMYYRGMWACLESGLVSNSELSRDDVLDGHWDVANTKEGFGYFAPDMDDNNDNDGTVECDDGSIWVRGATLYGFSDAVNFLCAINRGLEKVGDGDRITPNDENDCEKSTKFDVVRNGNWQGALTKALDEAPVDRPSFHIQDNSENGSMYYLIGAHSLEVFCGSGVPLADGISDLTNDENRVSVDLVDTETGGVQKSKVYFLKGDRDEDSKVDDVYYDQGGNSNEAADRRCHEMASMTRDHSGDFSLYLIKAYNEGVATEFKADFTVTNEMKKAICGNPPQGTGDIPGPAEKTYNACVTGIATRFNSAVDTCKNGPTLLPVPMTIDERSQAMKQCLKKALPKAYDKAIDALQTPNVDQNDDGQTTTPEDGTSCAVEGIGWIVCPVMNFLAKLNDSAFSFLKSLLDIKPALITDDATRNAWSAFRDIANVAFVIAFIFIVYSQLTSVGISNYGVKRMLPRLFIAAILVNVSYWVCAAAVDISNIVGSNIYSLLGTSIDVAGTPAGGSGETWSDIMGTILAVAAGVLLVIVVILAPTVLLALAVILLILVARQALVIMLIVLSPLAFVAYLLPNTEDWFKRWWKMLSATLMVYPIVGLVFGASTLASTILMNVANSGTSGDEETMLKLVAMSVLAIPLFAVPALLKGSMSAAGSIGGKLSNLADRTNKRALGDVNKAKEDMGNRWKIAAMNGNGRISRGLGGLTRYRARRDSLRNSRSNEAARSANSYFASQLGETDANGDYTNRAQRLQNAAAGGTIVTKADPNATVRAAAIATQGMHKQFDDDVAAFKTTMTSRTNEELVKAMADKSKSVEERAAAAGMVMGREHRASHLEAFRVMKEDRDAARASGDMAELEATSNIQKQMLADGKHMPFAAGDQTLGKMTTGEYDGDPKGRDIYGELQTRVGTKLSAEKLATLNPDELKSIYEMARGNHLTTDQLNNLRIRIDEIDSIPQLAGLVKPEARAMFDDFKSGNYTKQFTEALPQGYTYTP